MITTTSTQTIGTLAGYGRLPWSQARDYLEGATCLWADFGGYHIGPAPVEPPLTSHLWAWWSPDTAARARLDESDVYLAILRLDDSDPRSALSTRAEPLCVEVQRHPAINIWRPTHTQRSPQLADGSRLTFDLLEISGPSPTTFITARTRHAPTL